MEDIKLCPIRSINCPDCAPCLREACALWGEHPDGCAFAVLATAMKEAANELSDIALNEIMKGSV